MQELNHTIQITIRSDRSYEDVHNAVRDLVLDAAQGYSGDPEQEPLYGATIVDTPRIIARFNPQAWINNYAIEVDAEGEQEWDATEGVASMSEAYRTSLLDEIDEDDEALDAGAHGGGDAVAGRDDWLRNDPNAPEWVRRWHGPFDIRLRYADD